MLQGNLIRFGTGPFRVSVTGSQRGLTTLVVGSPGWEACFPLTQCQLKQIGALVDPSATRDRQHVTRGRDRELVMVWGHDRMVVRVERGGRSYVASLSSGQAELFRAWLAGVLAEGWSAWQTQEEHL